MVGDFRLFGYIVVLKDEWYMVYIFKVMSKNLI